MIFYLEVYRLSTKKKKGNPEKGNKGKRIFSLVLVVFLLALYITTFVVACFTTKETGGLYFACLFSTVMIPILLYAYQLIFKVLQKRNEE